MTMHPKAGDRAAATLAQPGSWLRAEQHLETAVTHPWYRMLLRLQDSFYRANCAFWSNEGVASIFLPMTTGAISSPMGLGSDSQPVRVELAGVPTYLADSMQFGLEFGCRMHAAGTHYLMPSFRGEECDARHLSQFMHSEAEVPGELDDVISLVERYVRFITEAILAERADDIMSVAGSVSHVESMLSSSQAWTRLEFDDACGLLKGEGVIENDGWRNLSREAELDIIRECGPFTWVTHWDELAVPFYQAVDEQGRALNGDLLFGIGETVGCGQRHATDADTRQALARHGVSPDSYGWYLDMKAQTPLQTAGFGMGVERYFMWLLASRDIRDFQLMIRENGIDHQP